MLTGRGRSVAIFALVLFAAGRLLALRELHMAAAALIVLLVAAVAGVIARRGTLTVRRAVSPARTTAGGEIRVDLAVRNAGKLGGGPVLFEDAIPERLHVAARLALPSLPAGAERMLAYVLRPNLRGRYRLGPLEVALTDPFGLVLRRQQLEGTSTIVVYPSFDHLDTILRDTQRSGAVRRAPLIGAGDEFYALRAYQEGDDMRKVHWPSSMRLGEIVVRQEEVQHEPGMLIVLDTCGPKHRGTGSAASIEAAVSACASVASLALRHGVPLQIVTASGTLLRTRRPSEEDVLEALATLRTSGEPTMMQALSASARAGASGVTLVTITPGMTGPELDRAKRLARSAAGGVTVHVAAPTFGTGAQALAAERATRDGERGLAELGLNVLRLRADDSFYDVWETGVRDVVVAR